MWHLENFEFFSDLAEQYIALARNTRDFEKKERCLRKAREIMGRIRTAKEEIELLRITGGFYG